MHPDGIQRHAEQTNRADSRAPRVREPPCARAGRSHRRVVAACLQHAHGHRRLHRHSRQRARTAACGELASGSTRPSREPVPSASDRHRAARLGLAAAHHDGAGQRHEAARRPAPARRVAGAGAGDLHGRASASVRERAAQVVELRSGEKRHARRLRDRRWDSARGRARRRGDALSRIHQEDEDDEGRPAHQHGALSKGAVMKKLCSAVVALGLACAGWSVRAQGQGEITLLAVGPMRAPTQKIVDAFQAKSGRTVKITYGNGVETRRMVAKGQPLDVSLLIAPFPGALTSGTIVLESATPINTILTAVGVPKGRPKPDISTPDAVKKALLAAKRIGYEDPDFTAAGQGPWEALTRLGIAEQVAGKSEVELGRGSQAIAPNTTRNTIKTAARLAHGHSATD